MSETRVEIQPTKAGDYLLRVDHQTLDRAPGRGPVRFASQTDAAAAAALIEEHRAAERLAYATAAAADVARDKRQWADHRDLCDRQLAWQQRRSALYAELAEEQRRRDTYARHGMSTRAADPRSYLVAGTERAEARATADAHQASQLAERWERYERLRVLDAQIKDARKADDIAAWSAALDHGDAELG